MNNISRILFMQRIAEQFKRLSFPFLSKSYTQKNPHENLVDILTKKLLKGGRVSNKIECQRKKEKEGF